MVAEGAKSLGAILLAAGGSSRLGRPKQLVEIGGEPLVLRQVRLLLNLEPALVVVVTGAHCEDVTDLLAGMPVKCVQNPDWTRGMGSSLACGIRAMPERVRAAFIMLCDQWKLDAADLVTLVDTWTAKPQAAVVCDYGETTGPPAILPRSLFDRLLRLRGDTGARRLLKKWKGEVTRIPMPHAALDIDQPGDLGQAGTAL